MASLVVQFKIHDTGACEWWITNEDGSQVIAVSRHNLNANPQVEYRMRDIEGVMLGAFKLLKGFRFVPFIRTEEVSNGVV